MFKIIWNGKWTGAQSIQHVLGAAREIIAGAGKSSLFMALPTDVYNLLRDAVSSLSLEHEFVRPLYYWHTSRPHA